MEKRDDFNARSVEQAMAFAATPAGKQLIAMLQSKRNMDFGKIQEQITAGNMESAKNELSSLLTDPQVQALLKQFGA